MNAPLRDDLSSPLVAILYNAVGPDAGPDEKDVLQQVEAVALALTDLGMRQSRISCTLNLETVRRRLETDRPDVVVNLVEALGGSDRLMHVAPALFDTLGIPYTGAPTDAIYTTGHKLLAKARLKSGGLPTPAWLGSNQGEPAPEEGGCDARLPGTFIVKTLYEHASFGIDDDAVVEAASTAQLAEFLARREQQLGRPCFAEEFIRGREFNLSVLAGADGPQVLPTAEIDFGEFPEGRPQIVGFNAKWEAESAEYQKTPRRFLGCNEDRALQDRLGELCRQAWHLFGLRGYARVDFRVDERGRPWILEVNANPCLSPDAGFAAALNQAGILFREAVARLLRDASHGAPARAGSAAESVPAAEAEQALALDRPGS